MPSTASRRSRSPAPRFCRRRSSPRRTSRSSGRWIRSASSSRSAPIAAVLIIFSIMLADFFDTMGTLVGVGAQAGYLNKKGEFDNVGRPLLVDSLAAVGGGFCRPRAARPTSRARPASRPALGPGSRRSSPDCCSSCSCRSRRSSASFPKEATAGALIADRHHDVRRAGQQG